MLRPFHGRFCSWLHKPQAEAWGYVLSPLRGGCVVRPRPWRMRHWAHIRAERSVRPRWRRGVLSCRIRAGSFCDSLAERAEHVAPRFSVGY
ncbi:MAG: hypothetical protein ACK55I_08550, partial [bacterium]